MAVTIVGAGAIGGVTGACLARAGHDVLLVDQAADHVAATNERGLAIVTPDGAWTAAVRAVTPDALPPALDLVLLAGRRSTRRLPSTASSPGSWRGARSCPSRTG